MTLRHTRSLILPTIAIYDPDCADPGCFDCKVRRKWEAALAELALAEAVIEAARHAVSHYDATDTVPWIEDLIDAVAALDAAEKEQD